MLAGLPAPAIASLIPVHPIIECEGRVERNRDLRLGRKKTLLINTIPFLLANGIDLFLNCVGKQKFTTHQSRDGHAACLEQVIDQIAQPFEQFDLVNIHLSHLPVEPQDECFWRPPFHSSIQNQLLIFTGKLIGDALAFNVNLKTACRLADRELIFVHLWRMVEQRPVVGFHKDVRIGKFQRALDIRHQTRNLEFLPLFSG